MYVTQNTNPVPKSPRESWLDNVHATKAPARHITRTLQPIGVSHVRCANVCGCMGLGGHANARICLSLRQYLMNELPHINHKHVVCAWNRYLMCEDEPVCT